MSASVGSPCECAREVGAGFEQRDERLIGQQDPLLLVGPQAVSDDGLPHGRVERLVAGLIPLGWRRHRSDGRCANKEAPGRLLLEGRVLEIDEHQALLGDDVREEAIDESALVAAVHEPARLEPENLVGVVLALRPVVIGFVPKLLIHCFSAEPPERDGLERVRGHRHRRGVEVPLQRAGEAVRVLLNQGVAMCGHERPALGEARQAARIGELREGLPRDLGFPRVVTLVPDVLQQQAGAVVERARADLVVPGLVSPGNAHGDVLHDCHPLIPPPVPSAWSSCRRRRTSPGPRTSC